ncbi:MAG: hypothetical protein KJ630_19195 [Proteobacteria bacterium]|nr:hypothetical protein [Pseudomonadota bacterium]
MIAIFLGAVLVISPITGYLTTESELAVAKTTMAYYDDYQRGYDAGIDCMIKETVARSGWNVLEIANLCWEVGE